eukprot:g6652.t1
MACTDEELDIGMSMVGTLHKAREFQIQKELKQDEERKKKEIHDKWVKEGWKDRTETLKYERPNSTPHERWYYSKVHDTHKKMLRGQANPQLVFFKDQMFETNQEEVNLGNLKIKRNKALLVGEYILFCNKLMILDLANNYIDKKGIVTLAENINKRETLKWLNLRRNQLEDEGTTYLCKYLGENTKLLKLDISDNRIKADGGNAIARMLLRNVGLKELYIQENLFDIQSYENLEKCKATRLIMKSNFQDPDDRRFEMFV